MRNPQPVKSVETVENPERKHPDFSFFLPGIRKIPLKKLKKKIHPEGIFRARENYLRKAVDKLQSFAQEIQGLFP